NSGRARPLDRSRPAHPAHRRRTGPARPCRPRPLDRRRRGPRPPATGGFAGGKMDPATAFAGSPARLQRQEGLLSRPGNRRAHPLPGQGQARPAPAVDRRGGRPGGFRARRRRRAARGSGVRGRAGGWRPLDPGRGPAGCGRRCFPRPRAPRARPCVPGRTGATGLISFVPGETMHRNLLCAALLGALSLAPVASATGARPVDPNAMERAARVANPGPIDARIVGAWDVWIPGAVYYTTDGVRVNQHYQAGAAMNRLEIARDGSYRWGDARGRLEEVRPWHAQADRRYFRVVHASGDEYEFYYGSGDKLVVLFGGVGGHAATGTRL